MEVFQIISQGIINDQLSLTVFIVLAVLFLIDITLYIIIWINLFFLNQEIRNGLIYKAPLRQIIAGFEDLIKMSTHQVNSRVYVEDFFSRFKASLIPLPLLAQIKIPVISTIKFIKDTVSLFILVGVLGTFIGIYISLVNLLNPAGGNSILTGLESITPVLAGMGTAFATSIAGMSFALLTTFILKLFNAEQFLVGIMTRLENYLDNEVKISKRSFMARSFANLDHTIEKGFGKLEVYGNQIYEAIKGFAVFSEQFKEAAAHMEDFNTNLAGSMEDLKVFYQSNKDFTEGFSQDIKTLNRQFTQLFRSIDQLSEQQSKVIEFVEQGTELQRNSLAVLTALSKEITASQQEMFNQFSKVWGVVKKDALKVEQLLQLTEKTAGQQEKISSGYLALINTLERVQQELTANFANNVAQLSDAMGELKKGYHNEMSRNIKTFAEHVSLSNKIINQGFDSLVNKFEQMDLILGKYLSGLAFNATDLEGTITGLNSTVKSVEHSIKLHNSSVRELKKILLPGAVSINKNGSE